MQEQAEPTSSRRPHAGRLVLGLCAMVLIAAPGCKLIPSKPYESEYTLFFEKGSGEIADNAIAIQVLLCDDRDGYRYPGLFGGGEIKKAQIETWMMSDDAKLKQTLKNEQRFRQITFRPGETQKVTFGEDVTDRLNKAEAKNATILIVANFSTAANPQNHFTRITLGEKHEAYKILVSQGEVVARPVEEAG